MPAFCGDIVKAEYVKQFEDACAKWTDERFITGGQIYTLGLFSEYLVNLSDTDGWVYYGHSFKVGKTMSVLVIKATIDEDAVVCFTSGRTFGNCVKIFIRKMLGDMVEWRADQYR